ncbi:MAG: ABC transporter ATP-binding protein [Burkholderiales bacterium]
MLRAENLTIRVPGRELCRDLSVEFSSGQCWAVMGSNGSGKTSLMHVLSGLATPSEGRVTLDGRPLKDFTHRDLALRVGVLFQHDEIAFWGNVEQYVALGRFPHRHAWRGLEAEDREAGRTALNTLGLEGIAKRTLASLSGGERQLARIALLLTQAPSVYCLDEPLLHLDLRRQTQVMALLKDLALRAGHTVIVVLHEALWASRYCDRAVILFGDGRVSCGPGAELLTRESLSELYQCGIQQLASPEGPLFIPR